MNQGPEIPQWLKETQNNSWNPELLISGLSLVFLYSLSDQVSEFNIWLIQANGLNPILVYFGTIYIAFSFAALKWTLTLHLILRGLWVAWLGLNYVYPQGVVFEKLPKASQNELVKKELQSTTKRVMLLESICSSIFGLAFTIVGLSLFIMIFYSISLILDLVGVPFLVNVIGTFVLYTLIWAILPLNNYLSKRQGKTEIPFLSKIYQQITKFMGILFFRESMMTYQTNMKKVTYHVRMAIIIFISLALAVPNIFRTIKFIEFTTRPSIFDHPLQKDELNSVKLFNNFYRDRNTENRRVHKAEIPSYQVQGEVMEIFIPEFRWDHKVFEIVVTDTVDLDLEELVTLKIGNKTLQSEWYSNYHPVTGQRGWTSFVAIDQIENGPHKIRIDKWLWDYRKREAFHEENYIIIPFWKSD